MMYHSSYIGVSENTEPRKWNFGGSDTFGKPLQDCISVKIIFNVIDKSNVRPIWV